MEKYKSKKPPTKPSEITSPQQCKQKITAVKSYQLCSKLRSQIPLVNASHWAANPYKAFRCSVLYKTLLYRLAEHRPNCLPVMQPSTVMSIWNLYVEQLVWEILK